MAAAKWILGVLGFVLGGPIGAAIGFSVGAIFDTSKSLPNNGEGQRTYSSNTQQTYRGRPTQGDIRMSILVLAACVMKADGHVRRSELDKVKQFLSKNYTQEQALQALQVLRDLLDKDLDDVAIARQIAQYVNYSVRLEILHFLLDLANADDEFAAEEQQMIERIRLNLGISDSDYRSLISMYVKQQNPNWMYDALEISKDATNEEVKKAYRRMAMKYHPDKVASAGEDVKAKATEKFRNINEAYEKIKSIRGIA